MKKVVFDQYWFEDHQLTLVWFANTWIGKLVLFPKRLQLGMIKKVPICKIDPYSVHQYLGELETGESNTRAVIFVRNEFARRLYFMLWPIWYLMHSWDVLIANPLRQPSLNFGFDTLTASPGSEGANNPVAGYVRRSSPGTWASLRGGAGTDSGTRVGIINNCDLAADSSNFYRLTRYILCFNTSSITSAATISSAYLNIRFTGKSKDGMLTDAQAAVDIVQSYPASTTSLSSSDFWNMGTTSLSRISYSAINAAGYNQFNLNASGISNIDKTGLSRFGNRYAVDSDNGTPTFVQNGWCGYNISDESGGNPPQLVVTYSTSSIKTISNLAKASVKTINNLAIGSVKTKNNLA